ncbi:MAG: hypothetical protein JRD89_03650 [Deltaproteobacteria bacterium]|nr:hypothetical protein [Deltaproteobacteria bacterium]
MALLGVKTPKGPKDITADSEGRLYTAPKIGGSWLVFKIAASGTTSNAVDLGDHYENLQVILPSLTSTTLQLQVSETLSGTYQAFGNGVTTETTTGSYSDTWTLGGWRFVKIVAGTTQTSEVIIRGRGVTL